MSIFNCLLEIKIFVIFLDNQFKYNCTHVCVLTSLKYFLYCVLCSESVIGGNCLLEYTNKSLV